MQTDYRPEPATDYDSLKRQFFALVSLINSKNEELKRISIELNHFDKRALLSNEALISSERDANELLTNENLILSALVSSLSSQLKEVQQTSLGVKTGESPCQTFCEAIATSKMLRQSQASDRFLKSKLGKLKNHFATINRAQLSQDLDEWFKTAEGIMSERPPL